MDFKTESEVRAMEKKSLYLGVDELMQEIGCKKSKAYSLIRTINEQMHQENDKLLVIPGKVNRAYFEKVCMR